MIDRRTGLSLLITAALLSTTLSAFAQAPENLETRYRKTGDRIIQAAMLNEGAWEKLAHLCDRIGPRLSGSAGYDEAVRWAVQQMKTDGLQNVMTPPVKVPCWVRGREQAALVEPFSRALHVLGLGGSVPTPAGGLVARVVVVKSFEELEALAPETARGAIVLFNPPWEGYGRTVRYRSSGASRAAKAGAAGVLIRSVTPNSLQSPHTGMLNYEPNVPKIPAAALSVEDAAFLERLYSKAERPTVRLELESQSLPDADSANVVGEIRGSEKPEEIVVISAHLDSWDVGQGAHDDGGGCVVALESAHLIQSLGLKPRRTIRVVLFANEENGLQGGTAYREWVKSEIKHHVAAIELDSGVEKPQGFGASFLNLDRESQARSDAFRKLGEIGKLLETMQSGTVSEGGGGADIGPLMREGVPGFALRSQGGSYFDWHHSAADTLDKVNPDYLRRNLAAATVLLYVLADMPDLLVSPEPPGTN